MDYSTSLKPNSSASIKPQTGKSKPPPVLYGHV